MRTRSSSALYRYIETTFTEETPWLNAAKAQGEALVPGMQISAYEGQMLYVLTKMMQANHILEIGTFMGYSTLWMASALPKTGSITTIEASEEHASYAQAHIDASPHAAQCRVVQGKALEVLHALSDSTQPPIYDIIFIDAAKGEYLDYLNASEPMLRVGGLMIADNSLLFGHMFGEPQKHASKKAQASMRALNEVIGRSGRYAGILLPTEEGLTVGVKLP